MMSVLNNTYVLFSQHIDKTRLTFAFLVIGSITILSLLTFLLLQQNHCSKAIAEIEFKSFNGTYKLVEIDTNFQAYMQSLGFRSPAAKIQDNETKLEELMIIIEPEDKHNGLWKSYFQIKNVEEEDWIQNEFNFQMNTILGRSMFLGLFCQLYESLDTIHCFHYIFNHNLTFEWTLTEHQGLIQKHTNLDINLTTFKTFKKVEFIEEPEIKLIKNDESNLGNWTAWE